MRGPVGLSRGDNATLYAALGLGRHATQAEIRRAFRSLARECHPDKGGSKQLFQLVSSVYEILRDDDLKWLYDNYGAAVLPPGASSTVALWSREERLRVQARLEDLYSGRDLTCTLDDGSCVCVRLYPGAADGDTTQFRHPLTRRNTVIEVLQLPHARVLRSGDDLHTQVSVASSAAAPGSIVEFDALRARRLQVAVPAEIQSGRTVLCFRGYGMPVSSEDRTRPRQIHAPQFGDLYVHFRTQDEDGPASAVLQVAPASAGAYAARIRPGPKVSRWPRIRVLSTGTAVAESGGAREQLSRNILGLRRAASLPHRNLPAFLGRSLLAIGDGVSGARARSSGPRADRARADADSELQQSVGDGIARGDSSEPLCASADPVNRSMGGERTSDVGDIRPHDQVPHASTAIARGVPISGRACDPAGSASAVANGGELLASTAVAPHPVTPVPMQRSSSGSLALHVWAGPGTGAPVRSVAPIPPLASSASVVGDFGDSFRHGPMLQLVFEHPSVPLHLRAPAYGGEALGFHGLSRSVDGAVGGEPQPAQRPAPRARAEHVLHSAPHRSAAACSSSESDLVNMSLQLKAKAGHQAVQPDGR